MVMGHAYSAAERYMCRSERAIAELKSEYGQMQSGTCTWRPHHRRSGSSSLFPPISSLHHYGVHQYGTPTIRQRHQALVPADHDPPPMSSTHSHPDSKVNPSHHPRMAPDWAPRTIIYCW
jgi:hypothetical protein